MNISIYIILLTISISLKVNAFSSRNLFDIKNIIQDQCEECPVEKIEYTIPGSNLTNCKIEDSDTDNYDKVRKLMDDIAAVPHDKSLMGKSVKLLQISKNPSAIIDFLIDQVRIDNSLHYKSIDIISTLASYKGKITTEQFKKLISYIHFEENFKIGYLSKFAKNHNNLVDIIIDISFDPSRPFKYFKGMKENTVDYQNRFAREEEWPMIAQRIGVVKLTKKQNSRMQKLMNDKQRRSIEKKSMMLSVLSSEKNYDNNKVFITKEIKKTQVRPKTKGPLIDRLAGNISSNLIVDLIKKARKDKDQVLYQDVEYIISQKVINKDGDKSLLRLIKFVAKDLHNDNDQMRYSANRSLKTLLQSLKAPLTKKTTSSLVDTAKASNIRSRSLIYFYILRNSNKGPIEHTKENLKLFDDIKKTYYEIKKIESKHKNVDLFDKYSGSLGKELTVASHKYLNLKQIISLKRSGSKEDKELFKLDYKLSRRTNINYLDKREKILISLNAPIATKYAFGDINFDGKVNSDDINEYYEILWNFKPLRKAKLFYDLNGDNIIDINDANVISNYNKEFPSESIMDKIKPYLKVDKKDAKTNLNNISPVYFKWRLNPKIEKEIDNDITINYPGYRLKNKDLDEYESESYLQEIEKDIDDSLSKNNKRSKNNALLRMRQLKKIYANLKINKEINAQSTTESESRLMKILNKHKVSKDIIKDMYSQ